MFLLWWNDDLEHGGFLGNTKAASKCVTDYGSIFGKCHDACISRAALFAYAFSGSCDGFAKCMNEIFVAVGPAPLPHLYLLWLQLKKTMYLRSIKHVSKINTRSITKETCNIRKTHVQVQDKEKVSKNQSNCVAPDVRVHIQGTLTFPDDMPPTPKPTQMPRYVEEYNMYNVKEGLA